MSSEITVVIPTWNRRDLVGRCLLSLESQSSPCVIKVVDNGSTDDTVSFVEERFPTVEVIRLPENRGFSAAVNLGIRQAQTPYVALLNNDAEADSEWVQVGLRAFQTYPQFSFFASRMIQFHDRSRLDSAGDCYTRSGLPLKRGYGDPISQYDEMKEVLGASAGAAFYRREIFEEIGYFDEFFRIYLEDVDFSLRAQQRGFRCLYLPEAIVYHIEAASDQNFRQEEREERAFYSSDRVYWITRNRWLLMIAHQPARNFPFLLYGWTKSFFFHCMKVGFTRDFLRGLWNGICETTYAFQKRREIGSKRVITEADLCHLMRVC